MNEYMKQLEYPQKSKWRIIFVPQAKPPNNGFKNILEMFNKISGMTWLRLTLQVHMTYKKICSDDVA